MPDRKRLLVLPRYDELAASSRIRFFQYLPHLSRDWHVVVEPFFSNTYVREIYAGHRSVAEAIRGYARRMSVLRRSSRFDVVWFEAELMPWLPWNFERPPTSAACAYVADYDDAIFHRYDRHASSVVRALLGRKIAALMRCSTTVLAGNQYIASYAQRAGARRVEVVPSVVDLTRYQAGPRRWSSQFTIGWIGTPRTQHYVGLVADALEFAQRELNARIVLIGAAANPVPKASVELRTWNEATESAELSAIDVGIMPLVDSPWELGKCGYKLIQYMACGKPVVASPVGVNRQLVEHGTTGYLASSPEEWINAFRLLQGDANRASEMGRAGRAKVERDYSLSVLAPRVTRILSEAMS